MGNLATLLVKFGAAFLLACHADYSLAQDNATGKGPRVHRAFAHLACNAASRARARTWSTAAACCTHGRTFRLLIMRGWLITLTMQIGVSRGKKVSRERKSFFEKVDLV